MKKLILYLLVATVFVACNSDTKSTEDLDSVENITPIVNAQPEKLFDVPWAAILDTASQKITMTQTAGVDDADLNVDNVTESLNRKYPEIIISEPEKKGDTVFIKINDASYLTQGSGSMGAEIYMAEVTYSFTQIPDVDFVNFDFITGDHASPGTFKREDFKFKK